MFSVTYPVPAWPHRHVPAEAELATALGLLRRAVTATSFVVSLLVANRVYARFGVAGAALVLPLVYLAGFGLWLVAFSIDHRGARPVHQQVTQRGLSNAAWSAFYNVVPSSGAPRSSPSTTASPARSGRSCPGCSCSRAGSVLARDQVFWLGAVDGRRLHDRRRRHPAPLRGPACCGRSGPGSASRSSRADRDSPC